MRVFHAADERTPKTEDSLAERDEFEPSDDLVNCQYVIMRRQEDRTAEFEIPSASPASRVSADSPREIGETAPA
jgi:hypothetical protein